MAKPSSPTVSTQSTQEALRHAVKATLERKKKLGQYSVIWRENKIITQGEDAPKSDQPFS